jgi:hypothetical protein
MLLFRPCRQLGVGPLAVTSGLISSGMAGIVPGYDGIIYPNDPKLKQVAIQGAKPGSSLQLMLLCVVVCRG